MPTFRGPVVVCDVGANVAPKPHHLHEYARMCSVETQPAPKMAAPSLRVAIGDAPPVRVRSRLRLLWAWPFTHHSHSSLALPYRAFLEVRVHQQALVDATRDRQLLGDGLRRLPAVGSETHRPQDALAQ